MFISNNSLNKKSKIMCIKIYNGMQFY